MDPARNLSLTFTALANGTRRSLIHALARGRTLSGRELGREVRADLRSVARHLRLLERVGLIERVGEQRAPRFRLCQKPLLLAVEWIGRQETTYLQALDELDRQLSEAAVIERGLEVPRGAADIE